jgi:membrane protein
MFAKWMKFLKTDIWRIRSRDHSRGKSFVIRFVQTIALAVRGFDENKCKFKASALTFFSLLSIVPIIAVMFGIAKGFGLQAQVEQQLAKSFGIQQQVGEQLNAKMQAQQEILAKITDFANELLKNTNGGVIAGIGVAFLFWTIISVLSNIESSFNDIWGVIKPRSLARKFSDYLSTMFLCPILLVISGGLTIFVSTQISTITAKFPLLQNLGPAFWAILKLLPYVSLWAAFTFLFAFIPNTKVKFKSALIGGIVAGTIVQIVQWMYIKFQIGVANYGAIYGSFAALPLFLIWFQTSWLIVLFGAEVSFAHQNVETYEYEPDCLSVSHSFKTLLSLFITQQLVSRFCAGEKPIDASQLSHALDIPVRLVRQILYELTESGVLSEAKKNGDSELGYQPAIDADKITVKFVLDCLEHRGSADIPVIKSGQFDKLSDALRQLGETIEKSPANLLLKTL